MQDFPHATDVVICGGGPVGMALALALTDAGRDCVVLDPRPQNHNEPGVDAGGDPAFDQKSDPRTLALSYGSKLVLERLGIGNELAATSIATPIARIHVSQQGGFGRTVIDASDEKVPALGYVIAYSALETALRRASSSRVYLLNGARVTAIDSAAGQAVVSCTWNGNERRISARLVAIADGNDGVADDDGKGVARDYGQTAIVADLTPLVPHANRAWERFAKSGPIALLPKGRDYALVWSVAPGTAAELAALSEADFLQRIGAAMGGKAGRFVAAGPRSCFPLGLRYRRELAGERKVTLGNAAQTLHPVAGQGLNLGLRDVWALTHALEGCNDCGSAAVLADYMARRRIDRFGTIRFTDLLARVFTVDSALMRAGRGAALTLFDVLPPARHFLARRMIFGASAWP